MKQLIKCTFVAFLLFALSVANTFAQEIPEKSIGNWINATTNHWEYGFFEKFAIYQNNFWEYETLRIDKKGQIQMVLKRENQRIALKITATNDKQLKIKQDKGKQQTFVRMEKRYPDYPTTDTSTFRKPEFRRDSTTIMGCYRNLNKIPESYRQQLGSSIFEVSVNNFITGKEDNYYADIDSLGRFTLTLPIMDTQCLFVDWSRVVIPAIVEPKDTLFLFADLQDFMRHESDSDRFSYYERPKEVLFMGNLARVNNELTQYTEFPSFSMRSVEQLPDMEALRKAEEAYKQQMDKFTSYTESKPNLSDKYKLFKQLIYKYDFARDLMQRRFVFYSREEQMFEEGYMEYVQANFPLEDESIYLLMANSLARFLTDYTGYYKQLQRQSEENLTFVDVKTYLQEKGTLDNETAILLDRLNVLFNEIKEKGIIKELIDEYMALQGKLDETTTNVILELNTEELNTERKIEANNVFINSLFVNESLRSLSKAMFYYELFERTRKPLSDKMMKIVRQSISHPNILAIVEEMQQNYINISTKHFEHAASLKNTKHLKEYKKTEALFAELIKPYEGKVIYLDFWGTWCAPCRDNMILSKSMKEKLKGKEVIYMYLANNSPEESWKNFINEIDLVGEDIVHYRLPAEQQAMIERRFNVRKYPTYMLIDKSGNVVNTDAASPLQGELVIEQIMELLK